MARPMIIRHRGGATPVEITANGVYEKDGAGGYSPVTVNVPGGGPMTEIIEITENGEYTAPAGKAWRKIVVNVPQGEIKAPSAALTLNVDSCYDPVDSSLDLIKMTAAVVKGTNALTKLEFYVNNVLQKTVENVSAGSISFVYTPDEEIKVTTKFKCVVYDSQNKTGQSERTVTFVGKTFYGVLPAETTAPDESQILALSKEVKASKAYTWSSIDCFKSKLCYAYPVSLGALSSIKDGQDFPYLDSYNVSTVTVNGILYYCYLLASQMTVEAADGFKQIYA